MDLRVYILKTIADHHGRYSFRADGEDLAYFQVVASTVVALHADGLFEVMIPHYSSRHPGEMLDCVTASTLTPAGEAWLRARLRAA
ncbi:MAG: hypothetical protein IPJ77_07350 [Planctomycetes bacterium]|nr:hypothetical protein [Planctomycetota bacterium]